MTEILYGRRSEYGKGPVNRATLVCAQHRVAAPESQATQAVGELVEVYPAAQDDSMACVVCPLPNADLIGTEVFQAGTDGTYTYGGPSNHSGSTVEFSLRHGGRPVLRCNPREVAPASVPLVPAGPEIVVTKVPMLPADKRWAVKVSDLPARHFKTKRDATAYGVRALTIVRWWAQRDTKPQEQ